MSGSAGDEAGTGDGGPLVRIGELARRAGVPAATLRAWERRYGVISPQRGESGYRLYSEQDERRVRSMIELIEEGLAPAEAADRVRAVEAESPAVSAETSTAPTTSPPTAQASSNPAAPVPLIAVREELVAALREFDGESADRAIDRAIAMLSTEAFVTDIALPVLREVGARWAQGEADVSEEHFASALLRGRLLGLARGWGNGDGPRAILACGPGERHDLGVICFGIALRSRGWRISFLGPDTPSEAVYACAERISPQLVVVFAMESESFELIEADLREIAGTTRVMLAGSGADAELCERCGAGQLVGDPVEAAAAVSL